MKTALFASVVLLLLAMGASRKYSSVRAELVHQREAIDEAWDQLNSALEKRAELVPGMVAAMKPVYRNAHPISQDPAFHDLFDDLEDARTDLLKGRSPEEKIQASEKLSGALSRLLLLPKQNPKSQPGRDLKRVTAEMANAESRIALPRRKYNEALEHYNAQIQHFPENVVASIAGFTRNDAYLKTEPGRAPAKAR